MTEPVIVGIGEYKVLQGDGLIISYSLGSCVGVALYDPRIRVAGLAHIMLGYSAETTDKNAMRSPFKYADIGIRTMIHDMEMLGSRRSSIVAKIAGGACMFASAMQDPIFNIGNKNVIAVKKVLADEKIQTIAEKLREELRQDP